MKLIIAGGRDMFVGEELLKYAVGHYIKTQPNEIVSGGASGIDAAGERHAIYGNIDIKRFPANWDEHGRAAGPIRNREMAQYADELLLVWDGKSRGSASMKKEMLMLKKPVHEIILRSSL